MWNAWQMEKLAAEEEDEQGEWHGAEANEFFLGRGANDELYLIDQVGQPRCRRRIGRGLKF